MSWSRREFIVTSSLAAAAGTLQQVNVFGLEQPAGAPPPPAVPKFEPLRRNMGIFTARGGTIGWLVAPDAVLVIDSQFADTAQMFLDGLKPRTQRKIRSPHQHAPSPRTIRGATRRCSHLSPRSWRTPTCQASSASRPRPRRREANQVYADTTFSDAWKLDIGNEVVSSRTVLRPGAHERGRRPSSSSAPTSCTWAT